MFESADLGHAVDAQQFRAAVPDLRAGLLQAQRELSQSARCAVAILIAGFDGAGRGELANSLSEWFDPRHVETHGMGDPQADDGERPPIWRFWRVLPAKGRMGVFLGSWYTWPLLDRVFRDTRRAEYVERMEENARFERMLVAEGVLVIKLWLHLSKKQQREKLRQLAKDPLTRWRVTKRDWLHHALYGRFRTASETMLRVTSTVEAPWTIVSGADRRYRRLTAGKIILEALRKRLAQPAAPAPAAASPLPTLDNVRILRSLKLERKLGKSEFATAMEKYQGQLNLLTRHKRFRDLAVAVMFEGNDAAGKGGAIRRVASALEARMFQVVPVAAPSDEERARPYLWRFWRHIPPKGRLAIFDRSWYGRVLVERVEGFCSEHDWMRAYGEINDFETQLAAHGCLVVKFWLAISKDEQLRRFRERETIEFKRFKITPDDWRNRRKWDRYEAAVCDMVERTSTPAAPWTVVEANNKNFARIKVLKTLCRSIEARLD